MGGAEQLQRIPNVARSESHVGKGIDEIKIGIGRSSRERRALAEGMIGSTRLWTTMRQPASGDKSRRCRSSARVSD